MGEGEGDEKPGFAGRVGDIGIEKVREMTEAPRSSLFE